MIVIRRFLDNDPMAPFQYLEDKEGNLVTFEDKYEALEFFSEHGIKATEKELKGIGVYLHEITEEQYNKLEQLKEEEE